MDLGLEWLLAMSLLNEDSEGSSVFSIQSASLTRMSFLTCLRLEFPLDNSPWVTTNRPTFRGMACRPGGPRTAGTYGLKEAEGVVTDEVYRLASLTTCSSAPASKPISAGLAATSSVWRTPLRFLFEQNFRGPTHIKHESI